jgi:hypothetical protein
MAAVRAASRPRFRLEFLDLALPGFAVVFLSTFFLLGIWMVNVLQPRWLLELQVRAGWYLENLDALPWGLFASVGFAGGSAFVVVGLVILVALDRPVRMVRA